MNELAPGPREINDRLRILNAMTSDARTQVLGALVGFATPQQWQSAIRGLVPVDVDDVP
jgi:hypothetical protein